MANVRVLATDLAFPEGPVVLPDGSVVLVEIRAQQLTRVWPDGRKEVVAKMPGGPNGAAMGPDGKIYVCNNGGFSWTASRGTTCSSGPDISSRCQAISGFRSPRTTTWSLGPFRVSQPRSRKTVRSVRLQADWHKTERSVRLRPEMSHPADPRSLGRGGPPKLPRRRKAGHCDRQRQSGDTPGTTTA